MTDKVSEYVSLDWYDGPLIEIAVADCSSMHGLPGSRLGQVRTLGYWTENSRGEQINKLDTWDRVVVRMSRREIQALLDLVDGRQIRDFHGSLQICPLPPNVVRGDETPTEAALEKAEREVERLAELLPTCAQCDVKPAACFGNYEDGDSPNAACDSCCAHENEDGWCIPMSEMPTTVATVSANNERLVSELSELRTKIEKMRAEIDRTDPNDVVGAAMIRAGLV